MKHLWLRLLTWLRPETNHTEAVSPERCEACGRRNPEHDCEFSRRSGYREGAASAFTFMTMADAIRRRERDARIQETRDEEERRYRKAMAKVWGSTLEAVGQVGSTHGRKS